MFEDGGGKVKLQNRNRKKYIRIKSRSRFTVFVVFATLLMFTMAGSISGIFFVKGCTDETYKNIRVAAGDTLWSIAESYKEDTTDTRDAVARISDINNISNGEIKSNQIISIPSDL